ncbi:MAG TPA: hypothetical protein VF171_02075 [Trueperaceae bacterium]
MPVPEALNLLSLARTEPGVPKLVPGTRLEVRALHENLSLRLEVPLWLCVLAGELLVDLPHGDFRRLERGDSLHLEAGVDLGFVPLEETVILQTAPPAPGLPLGHPVG